MIRVAIDGVTTPVLESGPDASKLEALWPELSQAHQALMSMRGSTLGFYDLPQRKEEARALVAEAKRLRSLADDLVVLGIGGSSLGGQALQQALATGERPVRAHFVDNVDPDTLGTLLDRLTPERTAAAVITKSGSTIETLAQLLILRRWFKASVGQGEARSRMTFVTDPEKGLLRELARTEGIRAFDIPPNVGGRFSVLTAAGLLPAAYLGIDIEAVLRGAERMAQRVTQDASSDNPACLLAAGALFAAREQGASSLVIMPYSDALRTLSAWFVQLWAESLGKRLDRDGGIVHRGQTPIPAVGVTDQHAQLQLFVEGPRDKAVVMVTVKKRQRGLAIPDELVDHEGVSFLHGRDLGELLDAERRATRAALLNAGVPVIDVEIPMVDAESIGGLLMLFEAACACTGWAMGIDPFDQPGVEAGKRMAFGLLGRDGYDADAQQVLAREAVGRDGP